MRKRGTEQSPVFLCPRRRWSLCLALKPTDLSCPIPPVMASLPAGSEVAEVEKSDATSRNPGPPAPRGQLWPVARSPDPQQGPAASHLPPVLQSHEAPSS